MTLGYCFSFSAMVFGDKDTAVIDSFIRSAYVIQWIIGDDRYVRRVLENGDGEWPIFQIAASAGDFQE